MSHCQHQCDQGFSLYRKSLTKGSPVPGPSVKIGTLCSANTSMPRSSLFIRSTDGLFHPRHSLPPPTFVYSSTSTTLFPQHFYISVKLSFPSLPSISTYAMVDSGASTSCISEHFAAWHGLPRQLLDIPVPIMAVDDRPIASRLITQDILTKISLGSHHKT